MEWAFWLAEVSHCCVRFPANGTGNSVSRNRETLALEQRLGDPTTGTRSQRRLLVVEFDLEQHEGIAIALHKHLFGQLYVIADNKLALNAGWDRDILAIELQALIGFDFDVELSR